MSYFSEFFGCNFNKEYNELETLLKFGIYIWKYPTKRNVLRNSVIVLGGDPILDLTAAIFFGSAV